MLSKNELLQKLDAILKSGTQCVKPEGYDQTTASVLVIIHYHCSVPHIILTKRSTNVRSHTGEVCFPGGRHDPAQDRNLVDTAIRETNEELSLALSETDIIGALKPVWTLTSNFVIHPFIAIQQTFVRPVPISSEVERVIDAPLYELLDTMTQDDSYSNPSVNTKLYKFRFKNDIVWGATSRILKQLHDHLYKKNNAY